MPEKTAARVKLSIEGIILGLAIGLVGIVGVYYGSNNWHAPALASQHGAGIDAMMLYLVATTGSMFLIGHLILGFLIWNGSRKEDVSLRLASVKTEKFMSIALGVLMALIAEGGVVMIGMPVWDEYFMGETPEDALQIDVFAQQFAWNIRYPGPDGIFGRVDSALIDELSNPMGIDRSDAAAIDDVVVINQLYVPVDRPVQVTLRSRDVIHSFFLPNFRVKQDAVPGMSIPVWFVPTQEGRFELACTELCGLGHYRMMGFFNVLPQGEFEDWLQQQYASN